MSFVLRDGITLEASLPKKKSLNFLFSELERRDIHVRSMRNKANRLEELFLGLLEQNTDSKNPGGKKAVAGVAL
jgi:ABC-2 type transport system ATP-binding protein